jgi:hypothetical protein
MANCICPCVTTYEQHQTDCPRYAPMPAPFTPKVSAEKSRVQINFKSGLSTVIECDDFTAKYRGVTLTGIEWEGAAPIPMYINIGEVESVWEIPTGGSDG